MTSDFHTKGDTGDHETDLHPDRRVVLDLPCAGRIVESLRALAHDFFDRGCWFWRDGDRDIGRSTTRIVKAGCVLPKERSAGGLPLFVCAQSLVGRRGQTATAGSLFVDFRPSMVGGCGARRQDREGGFAVRVPDFDCISLNSHVFRRKVRLTATARRALPRRHRLRFTASKSRPKMGSGSDGFKVHFAPAKRGCVQCTVLQATMRLVFMTRCAARDCHRHSS